MVKCENCHSVMKKIYYHMGEREKTDFYKCPKCKLIWAPKLELDTTFTSQLNERKRQEALEDARNQEFEQVVALITEHIPKGNRGLDVGCSYGWFMKKVNKLYDMEGIEAEDKVAQEARDKGMRVYTGLFPDNLNGGAKQEYDFIIFNNVWEHINHTIRLIEGCQSWLKEEGWLIITVPLSSGGLYKTAECFEWMGRTKELARLWQLHFHSPHIYYFNKQNLKEIMKQKGFSLVECEDIRSIDVNKMQQRFEMDKSERHGKAKAFLFKLAYPILRCLPADKAVFVFHYDKKAQRR